MSPSTPVLARFHRPNDKHHGSWFRTTREDAVERALKLRGTSSPWRIEWKPIPAGQP